MKLKFVLYGIFGFAAVLAAIAVYLFYSETSGGKGWTTSESAVDAQPATYSSVVADRAKTVSGRGGKLIIAYSGDIRGSLDPCG